MKLLSLHNTVITWLKGHRSSTNHSSLHLLLNFTVMLCPQFVISLKSSRQ